MPENIQSPAEVEEFWLILGKTPAVTQDVIVGGRPPDQMSNECQLRAEGAAKFLNEDCEKGKPLPKIIIFSGSFKEAEFLASVVENVLGQSNWTIQSDGTEIKFRKFQDSKLEQQGKAKRWSLLITPDGKQSIELITDFRPMNTKENGDGAVQISLELTFAWKRRLVVVSTDIHIDRLRLGRHYPNLWEFRAAVATDFEIDFRPIPYFWLAANKDGQGWSPRAVSEGICYYCEQQYETLMWLCRQAFNQELVVGSIHWGPLRQDIEENIGRAFGLLFKAIQRDFKKIVGDKNEYENAIDVVRQYWRRIDPDHTLTYPPSFG